MKDIDEEKDESTAQDEWGVGEGPDVVGSPPKQRGRFAVRSVDKEPAPELSGLDTPVPGSEQRGRFAVKDATPESSRTNLVVEQVLEGSLLTSYPSEAELKTLLDTEDDRMKTLLDTEPAQPTERRGRFAVKDLDERSINHAQSAPNLAALQASLSELEDPGSTKSAGGLVCHITDFDHPGKGESPPRHESPQKHELGQIEQWAASMLENLTAQMGTLQAQNSKLMALAEAGAPKTAPGGSALQTLETLQGQLQEMQAKMELLEARNAELEAENVALKAGQAYKCDCNT